MKKKTIYLIAGGLVVVTLGALYIKRVPIQEAIPGSLVAKWAAAHPNAKRNAKGNIMVPLLITLLSGDGGASPYAGVKLGVAQKED